MHWLNVSLLSNLTRNIDFSHFLLFPTLNSSTFRLLYITTSKKAIFVRITF